MSLRNQVAEEFVVVRPHRDAMHAASDDLAAALHFSPDTIWRAPANSNTRPINLQPVLKRALDLNQRRLAIARENGDRTGEGQALGDLGITYEKLAAPRRAEPSNATSFISISPVRRGCLIDKQGSWEYR